MVKAIAISLENPFILALASLKNLSKATLDFMYGTPQRANYTFGFAVGIAVLGGLLNLADGGSLMSCGTDTLASAL